MSTALLRDNVEKFKERHAHGETPDQCFAPWYLVKAYGLSPIDAIRQSADTNQGMKSAGYDKNIDAFVLHRPDSSNYVLTIIQAKYSDSIPYIAKAVKGFTKTIEWLKPVLNGKEREFGQENKVLHELRGGISGLSGADLSTLRLEFMVIHLSDEDEAIINNRIQNAMEDLKDEIRAGLVDRLHKILILGPRLILDIPGPQNLPSRVEKLSFVGVRSPMDADTSATMYQGIGKLSELVEMYAGRRDHLFSKNVRSFLNTTTNVERGPSAKIKETLRQMSLKKDATVLPELFALYHNGVTIHASDVKLEGGHISFREPFVLNGCQTIVTTHNFFYGEKLNTQIDRDLWGRISIPVRVIDSRDEELIRTITVSNNRQNAISAAALRANEENQIKLEHRLAEIGIFYERQEGSFDYYWQTNPKRMQNDFAASNWGAVDMVDLARCLAASAGEFAIAQKVNDLFENKVAYERVFSQKRLSSVRFLVFLQNLHNVLGLVIKNDLDLNWRESYVKSSRVLYHVLCLIVRHIAKEKDFTLVRMFADSIWGKDRQLREQVSRLFTGHHTGLKSELKSRILTLEETSAAAINSAFDIIQRRLRLGNDIDPFATFKDFDKTFED